MWNSRFQKTAVLESTAASAGYFCAGDEKLRVASKRAIIDRFLGLSNVGHFFAQHAIGILSEGFQTRVLQRRGVCDLGGAAACGSGASFGARLFAGRLGFMPSEFCEADCGQLLLKEWPLLERTAKNLVTEGYLHAIPTPLERIRGNHKQVLLAGLPEVMGDLWCEFRQLLHQLKDVADLPDRGIYGVKALKRKAQEGAAAGQKRARKA